VVSSALVPPRDARLRQYQRRTLSPAEFFDPAFLGSLLAA